MRIAVASDLHLEFGDIELRNDHGADVLILSGDIVIANYMHDHPNPVLSNGQEYLGYKQEGALIFRRFIKRVSEEFPHVVVIAGNHEFYHGKWVASLTHLRHEYGKFPNVYFLERDMKVIDDITFVGGTLWTDCNRGDPLTLHSLRDMMADYTEIRNDDLGYTPLKPATAAIRHVQTMGYFKHIVEQNPDNKFVIVGHHAPSALSIAPYYKDRFLMNGGYYSDLSEFILDHPQIKLWTHGHMHDKSDYVIGETRVVCNPRGYHRYEPEAANFELQYLDI